MIIDFPMIPANKLSMSCRRLVYGRGVNDADYQVQPWIDGKKLMCPYYRKWSAMLERCYSPSAHVKNPTYSDCTVCHEWLTFSVFREWMSLQKWEGLELDKDIRVLDNRQYGPETCVFVSSRINRLLNPQNKTRGKYPLGVSFHKSTGKYSANCNNLNKGFVYLGEYDSPAEAHVTYLKRKYEIITTIATDVTQEMSIRVRLGLLRRAA